MPFPLIAHIPAARLSLRPVAATDLPDLLLVNGDAEVTRFLPYATWTSLDDGQAWLTRVTAQGADGSSQQLVIERQDDARVIGAVRLFRYDEGSERLEIGYVLGQPYWRQGFAREAVIAALGHCFGPLDIRRVEAEVNPANVASDALLRAVGFVREGTRRQRWVTDGVPYDVHAYGLLRDEWNGAP